MKFAKTLSREEMRDIKAGGGPCHLAYRNSDGSFYRWSVDTYSVSDAQGYYGGTTSNGYQVSGYCCASCGSGQFSNCC